MDYEKASIEFLNEQMDGDYKELMDAHLILDLDWLEGYDGGQISLRGYARMGDSQGNKEIESNIIVLFPPFFPFKDK